MLLLDTNVLLELILNRRRAPEVERLMAAGHRMSVTDVGWHAAALVLLRGNRADLIPRLVELAAAVEIVALAPADLERVVAAAERFRLDFDDAYQYVAAEKNGLGIVSFDADFDRTERGRREPAQAV